MKRGGLYGRFLPPVGSTPDDAISRAVARSPKMRIPATTALRVLLPLGLGLSVWALIDDSSTGPPQNDRSTVERGRYLVHHVAMCVECHSPRDETGELSELHLLEGGRIPVASPYPGVTWAVRTPHLAGLPGFEPEAVVSLLMTGHLPDGRSPRPPMPPFRLDREDALAVVAYLRSLE